MHYLILMIVLVVMPFSLQSKPLLLSGVVKSQGNQVFYSPKTDNWRVQVQWILPEGEVAQPGDIVIVFDSGSIQAQLEQEKINVISAEEVLVALQSEHEQKDLEANYAVTRAELLLEKAKIDAEIQAQHLSLYDYKKNQLAYEKALIELAKSKQALELVTVENRSAMTKQKITLEQHRKQKAYLTKKLSKMSLKATQSGPVLYNNHPWNGEKVFVGMTAQPGWELVEIPSESGLYVETWVHETDYKHIQNEASGLLRFDAYLEKPFSVSLVNMSSQPEKRSQLGNDTYYRAEFHFKEAINLALLAGMSAQIELNGIENEK